MIYAGCGYPSLTWDEARRSYGRAVGHGVTPEDARKLSPRCYRCTSSILRGDDPNARAGAVGQSSQ